MKKIYFYLFFILTTIHYNAKAVVINTETFLKNGGNKNDITNSIKTANKDLCEKSYRDPFYSVGIIAGCTATWIGEDDKWSYILTAAHCVETTELVTSVRNSFVSWNNEYIASGDGFFYVHPMLYNKPEGMQGASTDIGIFKLPKLNHPKDPEGCPIEQPIIYNLDNELNKPVEFVGHGMWGVGLDISGMYYPEGPRRLWGRSQIDRIIENDHALCAGYEPTYCKIRWARMAPGDSGCSWWQVHNNTKTIIAVTNGGNDCLSTGTRITKYADWIKSIFPGVKLFKI